MPASTTASWTFWILRGSLERAPRLSGNAAVAKPEDAVTPCDAIKDPYVLEFLDLKDEYSESDLDLP